MTRHGMERLKTRLTTTTLTEINLIFLAVNLVKRARELGKPNFCPLEKGMWVLVESYWAYIRPIFRSEVESDRMRTRMAHVVIS